MNSIKLRQKGMVLGHLVRKVVYYDLYEQMLEHNCDSTGYFN